MGIAVIFSFFFLILILKNKNKKENIFSKYLLFIYLISFICSIYLSYSEDNMGTFVVSFM